MAASKKVPLSQGSIVLTQFAETKQNRLALIGSRLHNWDDNKNPVVGKRIIPEVPIPVADQIKRIAVSGNQMEKISMQFSLQRND